MPIVNHRTGFTLIELLIVLAVTLVLAAALPTLWQALTPAADPAVLAGELAGLLWQAEERAAAGWHNSNSGVYLDAAGRQTILYRGASFGTRDPAADESLPWPEGLAVTANPPAGDFNFLADSGLPQTPGSLTVGGLGGTASVELNRWGLVSRF